MKVGGSSIEPTDTKRFKERVFALSKPDSKPKFPLKIIDLVTATLRSLQPRARDKLEPGHVVSVERR